jgi:hypothetical protein
MHNQVFVFLCNILIKANNYRSFLYNTHAIIVQCKHVRTGPASNDGMARSTEEETY